MAAEVKSGFTDIRAGWIDRLAPAAARPYLRLMRLDRPIGTWLLLLPCWWGLALAAEDWPDARLLVLFAAGALIMRGAGCTYNDIVDRDIDARVERTRHRPIPSGAVSVRSAVLFLVLQLLVALAILLVLNRLAVLLGLASMALVLAYPFMKRVTWWPQAFLGLTFNWGVPMGYAAAAGEVSAAAILLYAGAIAWTIGYDTIYAHQDKEDDALVGVKSTALLFGDRSRPWIAFFYGVAAALFAAAGWAGNLGWPYFVALVAAALQLGWQVAKLDLARPGHCLATFRSNRWVGWILFAGIAAGRVWS
jgi:4-hydroxybenzoate polyprenyltransferase